MRWSNEPVFLSAIVAGFLIAVSSALFLLDQGASLYLAAGTAIGQFGVVLGGGVIGRQNAYGPKMVDTIIDAEAVITAAERREHG